MIPITIFKPSFITNGTSPQNTTQKSTFLRSNNLITITKYFSYK